jgi:hypothetical protein
MKAPEKPRVLTIGHSTHTWKAFLDLLRAHQVKRVIDVRSIPDQDTTRSSTGQPCRKSCGPRGSATFISESSGLAPCTTRFA